jgi:hypothetical protein
MVCNPELIDPGSKINGLLLNKCCNLGYRT